MAEATDPVTAPFGRPVGLSDARAIIAAVQHAAAERGWTVSVAVLDLGGKLVALERMDRAMMASPEVAVAKAMGAIAFKRPTKALQEAIMSGFSPMLALSFVGMVPIEGGLPIVKDGEIIGSVGVSGQSPTGDAELAAIGLGAIT